MHPLQRRFLDVSAVVAALEGRADDPEALALREAVTADDGLEPRVLAAGVGQLSNELQQRLVVASTKAATARLLVEPATAARAQAALDGVMAAGANRHEALGLLQHAVLDESFGWAEDPGEFDAGFLLETLDGLPALARLDTEAVETHVDAFVKQADPKARPLRLAIADALLEAAWADGPLPIAAEHVDDAMDVLAGSVASQELERAGATLVELLSFLSQRGLLGPMRLARLTDVTRAAAKAPAIDDAEEPEDDPDDEP
ncbi:MAG: hypothetical protein INH41_31860 [Myxococcaceae bacterium]|nr:hypothetical protein [Myxococcaceae bacterium]MCA3017003.1 hypothetical protein [Myxococcaceae bacterium]